MSHESGWLRWENVRPVLVTILELLQSDPPVVPSGPEVARALGRSPTEERMHRQIAYLKEAAYLEGEWEIDQVSGRSSWATSKLRRRGCRKLPPGQWCRGAIRRSACSRSSKHAWPSHRHRKPGLASSASGMRLGRPGRQWLVRCSAGSQAGSPAVRPLASPRLPQTASCLIPAPNAASPAGYFWSPLCPPRVSGRPRPGIEGGGGGGESVPLGLGWTAMLTPAYRSPGRPEARSPPRARLRPR